MAPELEASADAPHELDAPADPDVVRARRTAKQYRLVPRGVQRPKYAFEEGDPLARTRRIDNFLGNPPYSSDFTDRYPGTARNVASFARDFLADAPRALQAQLSMFCGFLVDYWSLPETVNDAIMFEAFSHELRSAAGSMAEEKRAKVISGILAYIAELQEAERLSGLSPSRLANVSRLLSEALQIVRASDAAPTQQRTLFEHRPTDPTTNKKPTALEWYDLEWRARVEAGEVTGEDLKRLDPRYYSIFAATLSKRGQKISDFLPPSPSRGPRNETPEARIERQRAASRERMRRMRARRADPS